MRQELSFEQDGGLELSAPVYLVNQITPESRPAAAFSRTSMVIIGSILRSRGTSYCVGTCCRMTQGAALSAEFPMRYARSPMSCRKVVYHRSLGAGVASLFTL